MSKTTTKYKSTKTNAKKGLCFFEIVLYSIISVE